MSTDHDKKKHSKRLQQEQNAIAKQTKIIKSKLIQGNNKDIEQPHRLSKRHAMNCGNPKCILCSNPRKIFGEKTIQEQRQEQDADSVHDKHSNGLHDQGDKL